MTKTKFLESWKRQSDTRVIADDKRIYVAQYFKYLGSLKSADGNVSRHYRSLVGMTKELEGREIETTGKKKLLCTQRARWYG